MAYDVIFEIVELDIPNGAEVRRQVAAESFGVDVNPDEAAAMADEYVRENDVAVSPTVGLNLYITLAGDASVVADWSIGGTSPDRAVTWDAETRTFSPY